MSITIYYNFSEWTIIEEYGNFIKVQVGEIDDYRISEINIILKKDVYNNIKNNKLKLKKVGRSLLAYNEEKEIFLT